jgi:ergot alkaloid biosynthesis protein
MTILVTGGSGKTGRRLSSLLTGRNVAHKVALRQSTSDGGVQFDWTDVSSWQNALADVTSVYMIAPAIQSDPAPLMIDFASLAMQLGTKRFVLLSASLLSRGGPGPGTVHDWLATNALEWAVLRPSWFMQNFTEGPHAQTINAQNRIYSATSDGRVPFIDADDIARCAAAILMAESAPNTEFILTGRDLLSYDEVAARISRAVGRDIAHVRLSVEQLTAAHEVSGLNPLTARMLAMMDEAIGAGAENRTTNHVEELSGKTPTAFVDFVEQYSAHWRND